jgi:hypothetical protein
MVANKRSTATYRSDAQQRPKKIGAGSRKRSLEVVNSDVECEPQRKVQRPKAFAKARNLDLTGIHFQKLRTLSTALGYKVLLRMKNSGQCT